VKIKNIQMASIEGDIMQIYKSEHYKNINDIEKLQIVSDVEYCSPENENISNYNIRMHKKTGIMGKSSIKRPKFLFQSRGTIF
jgi:hypothetical protein